MSANLNTTMNGTQPSSCSFNPTAEKIGQTIAYCLLLVVSLAGNSIIGIIVYKTKTMRKPINFLIVNMAMSDLLFPIFLYPPIVLELYVNSWPIGGFLGQAFCKLCISVANVSNAVSIQSLVLIAVDRFGAVVLPLRSPLIGSKLCAFFILATWIVAMAMMSPNPFAFKLVENRGVRTCEQQWNEVFGESFTVYYNVAIYGIGICTPLVLIAILYTIILVKLKSQKTPGEPSVNAEQQRAKRERNVLKMSIAIVLTFVVCWIPFSIFMIMLPGFASDNMTWPCGFRSFHIISVFMVRAYCAINPCICFIFSENYRRGVKNLLRCFSRAVQSRNQVAP